MWNYGNPNPFQQPPAPMMANPYQALMGMMPPIPQMPLQVIAAFRLLDDIAAKEAPIVAVTSISVESIDRKELLPIEEKARAAALELLMAYMRSALQQ